MCYNSTKKCNVNNNEEASSVNYPFDFIKAGEEFSTRDKHIPAPYFRRSFELTDIPDEAELIITGLGFYEVYINGENITKGFLAPYRSNIDDIIYYDRYDITHKLKKGKNTVGILLGNGMRNSIGGFMWNFDKARFRGAPEIMLDIEATPELHGEILLPDGFKFSDGTSRKSLKTGSYEIYNA